MARRWESHRVTFLRLSRRNVTLLQSRGGGTRGGGTRGGHPRPVAPPHRGEHAARAGRQHGGRTGQQGVGQRLVGQAVLARDRRHPGVEPARVRQQPPAHTGVGAVGADEQVGVGGRAVGEEGAHAAVGQGLVALEGAAELDVQAVEQHLAQRDADDPVVLLGRVGGLLDVDDEQWFEPLGAETERGGLVGDGVAEARPSRRRQAGVQRVAAVRVDVDAVALHPVGAGALRSATRTGIPACVSPCARHSPPMPPPTTRTSGVFVIMSPA